jgi:hypothetical protein
VAQAVVTGAVLAPLRFEAARDNRFNQLVLRSRRIWAITRAKASFVTSAMNS